MIFERTRYELAHNARMVCTGILNSLNVRLAQTEPRVWLSFSWLSDVSIGQLCGAPIWRRVWLGVFAFAVCAAGARQHYIERGSVGGLSECGTGESGGIAKRIISAKSDSISLGPIGGVFEFTR